MSKQKTIKLVNRSNGGDLAELSEEQLGRIGELALLN
jgi:hypothetical protein